TDWAVSQAACGDDVLDESGSGHVQTCPTCAQRLDQEVLGVRAAVYETVPPAILAQALAHPPRQAVRSRKAWLSWSAGWNMAAGGVMAALMAVVIVSVGQPTGVTRLKGTPSLTLTVKRNGNIVATNHPIEDSLALRAGDELRLRVVQTPGKWVALQARERSGWVTFYEGAQPKDGWLPIGIAITPGDETLLRLVNCESEPEMAIGDALPSQGCDATIFHL
ncbi:MAG TPA: hypothetical protein VFH51_06085, partial [Myxococcota bacterium]|nr:hypothetical protein [Myxococcota bacterium]